jgi:hypothetical protein
LDLSRPMAESMPQHDLRSVAGHFQICGDFWEAAPYGSGHINDTYAAVFDQAGSPMRYGRRLSRMPATVPPG